MWCYCTRSQHHICNESIGKIKCANGTKHCVIGLSVKGKTQSCWEWPNTSDCPDETGPCYLLGRNTRQPACCCKGNLCNDISVKYSMKFPKVLTTINPQSFVMIPNTSQINIFWIYVGLLLAISLIASIAFVIVKRFVIRSKTSFDSTRKIFDAENRKDNVRSPITKCNEFGCRYEEHAVLINQISTENLYTWCEKNQLIAQGRFGQVWSGIIETRNEHKNQVVAIKIFSDNKEGKKSWQNESTVYSILQNGPHPNILKYFGVERRLEDSITELWLVVEYYPLGSLWNYLKKSTVTWPDLLKICQNIAAGLTHLHSFSKPINSPIAHRDIKSKNILLKENYTTCIADFGLAICHQNTDNSFNNRVGTLSYMAPEILEGSINFDIYSFLRIDIFSMSLVFWEVLSRCQFTDLHIKDFQNPFQEIVGENPSFEQLRQCVTIKKLRPAFNETWTNFPDVMKFWKTVTECWDEDPDARLSAECVLERMNDLCNINTIE